MSSKPETCDILAHGLQLARALEEEARRFPAKSDDHDILRWEAAIVTERVCALRESRMPHENLRDSALLGKWGERTAQAVSALTGEVRAFYHACDNQGPKS